MKKKDNLSKVFTGPEATALFLKARLEDIGVPAIIKNDSSTAFLGVVPASVDLYIQDSDLRKAEPVIIEINKSRTG